MKTTSALLLAAGTLWLAGGCSIHHATKEAEYKTPSTPVPIARTANWSNWNNHQGLGSFYAVAGSAKETVAVGIDGLIATRNNATGIWTIQTFEGDPDFRAVVYANNQYVVVREAGFIMTSQDGLKWTSRTSPTKENL